MVIEVMVIVYCIALLTEHKVEQSVLMALLAGTVVMLMHLLVKVLQPMIAQWLLR